MAAFGGSLLVGANGTTFNYENRAVTISQRICASNYRATIEHYSRVDNSMKIRTEFGNVT
jgi:hypothetical protein